MPTRDQPRAREARKEQAVGARKPVRTWGEVLALFRKQHHDARDGCARAPRDAQIYDTTTRAFVKVRAKVALDGAVNLRDGVLTTTTN